MAEGVAISTNIPEQPKKQLEAAAQAQERTISVVVRRAIVHYLECSGRGGVCEHQKDDIPISWGNGPTTATTAGTIPAPENPTPV